MIKNDAKSERNDSYCKLISKTLIQTTQISKITQLKYFKLDEFFNDIAQKSPLGISIGQNWLNKKPSCGNSHPTKLSRNNINLRTI